jgi:hypothetical protein
MRKILQNILLIIVSLFIFSESTYSQPTIQSIINQVKIDSLMKYVKQLSGVEPAILNGQPYTILSRHKNHADNDKSAEFIKWKFESYGLQTSLQSFSTTGKNVIGIKTGTQYPNKKYIICAHFDDMPSGSLAPGADDNASGTAGVIEAARIFSQYSFPFTLVFAAWDEEEQGLVGSAYYANQASINGDSILGVFNMDMIAYDSNNDNVCEVHTKPVANSMTLYNKMIELNQTYNIGLVTNTVNPGSGASDHASFWSKNFSAILLIEHYNNGSGGDFNAYYHTVNDKIQYFNIPYFEKCAKLTIAAFASFALNLQMQIQHTPPFVSTVSTLPYTLTANIISGLKIGTGSAAPRLYYRTSTGGPFSSFTPVTGTQVGQTTTYNFVIPGQSLGTTVQYYIAAQDSAGSLVSTSPLGGSGFNPPGSTPPATFHQFFVSQMIAIGNGTTAVGYPFYSFYHDSRTQMLYTAAEIIAGGGSPSGGPITKVGFDVTTAASQVLNGFTVKLKNTNLTTLTSWQSSGFTTVFSGTYSVAGTGWQFINLQQPSFIWDGTSNLLVEVCFDNTSYTSNSSVNSSSTTGNMVYHNHVDNGAGCTLTGTSTAATRPNIVILGPAIPVELISQSAVLTGKSVIISWQTATEKNNKGFYIEKSLDNVTWNELGFVQGKGTTTEKNDYSFVDNNLTGGINYYRIVQVDFDGTTNYYNSIELDLSVLLAFELSQNYPNPFNPVTTISFSVPTQSHVKLIVYDQLGNEVKTLVNDVKSAGRHSVEFDGSSLSSGVYFYKLQSENYVSIKKLILMK